MNTLIVQASPKSKGVTEALARELATSFPQATVLPLASYHYKPCCNCGFCEENPGACALDGEGDHAALLLAQLQKAPLVIFCAPIYFYALPAHAKALIDRSQRFWRAKQEDHLLPTLVVLHAGRKHGNLLFQGALLTLKYFFLQLSRTIVATHTLRGLERREDLVGNPALLREFRDKARAWACGLDKGSSALQERGHDKSRFFC